MKEVKKNTDQVESAPALNQIQQWMQQVLIDPLGTAEQKPQDFLDENWSDQPVEAIIRSSSRQSSRERLAIYQRSYLLRLRHCMAEQFKALAYALGEDLFEQFSDLYLQAHPSNSYTLTHLGENFAAFLQNTRPDQNQEQKEFWIDFMIELVEFEYRLNTIFDEHAPEDFNLANEQTPDENIQLLPLFYLFEHQYPIGAYYKAFINQQNPELPLPQVTHCAISRYQYQLNIHPLSPVQYYFLLQLQSSGNAAAAQVAMIQQHGFDKVEMQKAWQHWKTQWLKTSILCQTF